MDKRDKLSIYFYIYAVIEIFLTFLGANFLTRGYNIMLLIILIQFLGQVLITYEGVISQRYNTYRLFLGAVVPFIMLSIMMWYNTF